MKEPFDIRAEKDRLSLSRLLPAFDGTTFSVGQDDFLDGLSGAALCLGNPDWMVYQWGCFVLPGGGPQAKLVLSLDQVATLGLQLRRLSRFENFEEMVAGFANPSQFEDTRFEVRVADLFAQRGWVQTIRFAPEVRVRGRTRRPDFEASGINDRVYVECKRCHLFFQKALLSLNKISRRFGKVMNECNWPTDWGLEVEIAGRLAGRVDDFIHQAVQIAKETGATTAAMIAGPFRSYVVSRPNAFRLPSTNWTVDTMVIGDVATGILNPEFTMLRVANYRAHAKMQKSVGTRVNEALHQLPEGTRGMIFVGDVPLHIGRPVCEQRLNDQAYDHVIAFAVWDIDEPGPALILRPSDGEHVSRLFR